MIDQRQQLINQGTKIPDYDPDRKRHWVARILKNSVVVRHCAVLESGEGLDEYPPTFELTHEEWASKHGEYGLDIEGSPIEGGQ